MRYIVLLMISLSLAGCVSSYPPAPMIVNDKTTDIIQPSDQIRVIVFGEEPLSNVYPVDSLGYVTILLAGNIKISQLDLNTATSVITQHLQTGYLKDPHVAVNFEKQRDIYVLGEVQKPGNYSYSSGLTTLQAIAQAGGFTYRAAEKHIILQRLNTTQKFSASDTTRLLPGDSITVGERFF